MFLPSVNPLKNPGIGVRRRPGGPRVQRLAGDLHSRSRCASPLLIALRELDGAEAAARVHVDNRREAGVEIALRRSGA